MTDAFDEDRWIAVRDRNISARGLFLYAVTSTGIYCRPGCPSRRPKRENVRFFDNPELARAAGFRACNRCHPDSECPTSDQSLHRSMLRACRRLSRDETPPSLAQLAEQADLSPWHFHRLFKKYVGVTPKQYALAQRRDRFRLALDQAKSVTEAIHGAGYGSSSRAYENLTNHLGMTPTRYRQGGRGLTIRHASAPCFLGRVLAGVTDWGICAIELADTDRALIQRLREHFPQAVLQADPDDLGETLVEIATAIDRPGSDLDLPLHIQGTAFQQRVWQALRAIPKGQTTTYGQLATQLGQPLAVRAVAGACAANKLGVAVPCHRVVAADGSLTGYRWGLQRKRQLLDREKS
ncbi:bifunctional DNA-binding transcriptional regulator/O6-methylguanine-DNA methyltransferase Ada [Magnetospira sp. QH-2]|uniref:bifunctional DNA-binding transcriptional regulator/O6-methylguanine-DNA methyltransferase Ada n=1 Tax=Magnetospira sp. (strain QH-2) TaxID=1288970 RepID=UPI0003E812A7|nr:bifunctional DNA-binding transcriptional regulator/O6-methylguanine-DNA methyltransferase Ada [Magnetospira sp. QH-2]CCQ73327.1 Fused DNA-binding transcriptional dual regulator; O6-methylguanine-DNA methyltransferase [Magnetospira sp. QH-2]